MSPNGVLNIVAKKLKYLSCAVFSTQVVLTTCLPNELMNYWDNI